MPCDGSYMDANKREIELSRVACLLDELDGKPIDKHDWSGYHPRAYGRARDVKRADAMVAQLCERLQAVDVKNYSLEMQMWWRDHQIADKARVEAELVATKNAEERKAALAKLTPHERRLLGL